MKNKMDKNLKMLMIGMIVLIVLVPIGLLASGTAFGEWGTNEIQEAVGYIPAGLSRLSTLWQAPLADYALPGQGDTLLSQAPGYYISAIIGVAIAGAIMYMIAKLLIKK
jgi:hypothetical protein